MGKRISPTAPANAPTVPLPVGPPFPPHFYTLDGYTAMRAQLFEQMRGWANTHARHEPGDILHPIEWRDPETRRWVGPHVTFRICFHNPCDQHPDGLRVDPDAMAVNAYAAFDRLLAAQDPDAFAALQAAVEADKIARKAAVAALAQERADAETARVAAETARFDDAVAAAVEKVLAKRA